MKPRRIVRGLPTTGLSRFGAAVHPCGFSPRRDPRLHPFSVMTDPHGSGTLAGFGLCDANATHLRPAASRAALPGQSCPGRHSWGLCPFAVLLLSRVIAGVSAANTPPAVRPDIRLDGFGRGAGRRIRCESLADRPRDVCRGSWVFPRRQAVPRALERLGPLLPWDFASSRYSGARNGAAMQAQPRKTCPPAAEARLASSLESLGGACQAPVWATED